MGEDPMKDERDRVKGIIDTLVAAEAKAASERDALRARCGKLERALGDVVDWPNGETLGRASKLLSARVEEGACPSCKKDPTGECDGHTHTVEDKPPAPEEKPVPFEEVLSMIKSHTEEKPAESMPEAPCYSPMQDEYPRCPLCGAIDSDDHGAFGAPCVPGIKHPPAAERGEEGWRPGEVRVQSAPGFVAVWRTFLDPKDTHLSYSRPFKTAEEAEEEANSLRTFFAFQESTRRAARVGK